MGVFINFFPQTLSRALFKGGAREEEGVFLKKMSYYHLIIQAGGEGTRLMGENSPFPKILKTISGKTTFEHVMESLTPYGKTVVILNEKHKAWEKYFPKSVHVVYSSKTGDLAGVSEALEALKSERSWPDKVLVVWSDLLFKEAFSKERQWHFREDVYPFENILFLLDDTSQKCRLSFREDFSEDDDYRKCPFPGVFLLNFISDKTKLFKEWIEREARPSFDLLVEQDLQRRFFDRAYATLWIEQIGTKEEFLLHNKPHSSRSFNKIHFLRSIVVKESKNRVELEREYRWLKESYPQYDFCFSKRTFDLEMPRFTHSSEYPLKNILDGAIQSLCDLHETKTAKHIGLEEASLLFERLVLDKALIRLREFEAGFPLPLKKVDGFEIPPNLEERFRSLFKSTLKEVGSSIEYLNFVHGDSTLSNLCLNENGSEYVWIDPRPPFFEEYRFFGFKILDFVKLYYSLSGYDKLNRYELVPRIIDGNILIDELQVLEDVAEILPFPNKLLEKFMPFVWMSLAGYTVSTPIEASIAYGISIKKLLELTK